MDTLNPIEVSKAISEQGFMVVVCGFYLTVTAALMWYFIKRVTKSIDLLVDTQKIMFEMVKDIREGVNHDILEQINVVAGYSFDYSRLEVLRALDRIVKDNNLEDRAAVEKKINKILGNLQAIRRNRMSNFSINGKKLSEYIKSDWVSIVSNAMLSEIYSSKSYNAERAATSIGLVYDEIQASFFRDLRG